MKNFWNGFTKTALVMAKGERADKATGARPRTLIASKGEFTPLPFPSVDEEVTAAHNLKPEVKFEKLPKVKLHTSKINI